MINLKQPPELVSNSYGQTILHAAVTNKKVQLINYILNQKNELERKGIKKNFDHFFLKSKVLVAHSFTFQTFLSSKGAKEQIKTN